VEGKEKEKDKPASTAFGAPPFALSIPPGTKLFGDTTSSSSSGSIFGAKSDKDKEKEKDSNASPPSSVFGATTFGSPAKPSSSPFSGFGSATSAVTPSQFVFGVAAGAGVEGTPSPKAGNIGFSFGSPSRASSQPAAAAALSSGSGFGFAPAPTASSGASTPASTNLEAPLSTSRADTPATEGTQEDGLARTLSPGVPGGEGDVEGEGEEDEETTYTVKAKVFKFTTDREGASTWAELGVGNLRLKKHKVTNARRVILRSSSTGKIIINFRIYAGLQPKRTAKVVAFTGHITSPDKETQTVQYRLRVGTEAIATETAEAIEREVWLVQAEAST
jgi:nucleoporin NUP2